MEEYPSQALAREMAFHKVDVQNLKKLTDIETGRNQCIVKFPYIGIRNVEVKGEAEAGGSGKITVEAEDGIVILVEMDVPIPHLIESEAKAAISILVEAEPEAEAAIYEATYTSIHSVSRKLEAAAADKVF